MTEGLGRFLAATKQLHAYIKRSSRKDESDVRMEEFKEGTISVSRKRNTMGWKVR